MMPTLAPLAQPSSHVPREEMRGNPDAPRQPGRWGGLGHFAAIFAWEFKGFFQRPTSYVLLLTMSLLSGLSFSWLVTLLSRGDSLALRQGDDPVFQFLGPNLFLIGSCTLLVPLLTMDLIADERRRGTWEALLTTGVTPLQVLLGKFFAGWGLLLTCLSPWLYYLLVLRAWSGKARLVWGWMPWFDGAGLSFDPGPICGGAIGLAVISLTFIALGLFCSSACRGPLAAALLSFGAMLAVLVLSLLPRALTFWGYPAGAIRAAETIACWQHLERFSQGVIAPAVILGHLSACALLLWITWQGLRWRDPS